MISRVREKEKLERFQKKIELLQEEYAQELEKEVLK